MNRSHLKLLCVLILCSGCVQPGVQPPASEEEKKSTSDAFMNCTVSRIREIDDRSSDAATIARAAISLCSNEYEARLNAYSKGMTPGADLRFRNLVAEPTVNHVTALVLTLRSKKP